MRTIASISRIVLALSLLALPLAGQPIESCGDGIDNDLDGDVDCLDADCPGPGYALGVTGPSNPPSGPFLLSAVIDNAAGPLHAWSYGICHDPARLQLLNAQISPQMLAALGPVGGADFVDLNLVPGGYTMVVAVDLSWVQALPAGSGVASSFAEYVTIGAPQPTIVAPCATLGSPPVEIVFFQNLAEIPLSPCGLQLFSLTGTADECAVAETIPFVLGTTSVPLSTSLATNSPQPVSAALCPDGTLGICASDVWFQWTPTSNGWLSISTCGTAPWNTDLLLYRGSCASLINLACNGDGPGCPDFSSTISDIAVTAGTLYRIRVGGADVAASGTGQMELSFFPFLGVDDLTCSAVGGPSTAASLAWTEAAAYDEVRIRVDGILVQTLPGSGAGAAVTHVTAPLVPGSRIIAVEAILAGVSRGESCTVLIAPACGADGEVLSPTPAVYGAGMIQCGSGGFSGQNRFFRPFDLCAPPYSLASNLEIECVTIGIGSALAGGGLGVQPLILRLHIDPNGGPVGPLASLTTIYAESFEIPDQEETLLNLILGEGTVLSGSPQLPCLAPGQTLAVEIEVPNGIPAQNRLFLGSSALGSPEVGATYIVAPSCGFSQPISMAALGFPDAKLILDVGYDTTGACDCGDGIFSFSCAQVPATTQLELSWVNSGDVGSIDLFADGVLVATLPGTQSQYVTAPHVERTTVTWTASASAPGGAPLNEGSCTKIIAPVNNWASGAVAVPVCTGSVAFDIDNSVTTTGAPLDPAVCSMGPANEIWNDLWYCITAASGETISITACATGLDTRLAVYDNACAGDDPLAVVACDDDSAGGLSGCGDLNSRLAFQPVAGSTYLVRLGTFNAAGFGAGVLQIAAANAPPVVTGSPVGPIVLDAGAGDVLAIALQVSPPEPCQTVTLHSVTDPSGAVAKGLSIVPVPTGPLLQVQLQWAPDCENDIGTYDVTLTFRDSVVVADPPSTSTTISIQVVDTSCDPADLVITAVDAPRELAIGGTTVVEWTVRNDGLATAEGPWTESVYASQNGALDASDELLGTIVFSGSLPSGAEVSRGLSVFAPLTLPAGPITLIVCTDTVPPPGGVIVEASESNNCGSVGILLGTNDLAVQGLSAPTETIVGGVSSISWTTVNLGSATAFGGFSETIRFSADAVLDAGDPIVATIAFPGDIGPGEAVPRSAAVAVPAGTAPGNWFWILETGVAGSIPDANGGNDIAVAGFLVGTVDLELLSLSPPSDPVPGQAATVSWTVRNNGTISPPAGWQERLTLSADGDGDAGDDIPFATFSFTPPADGIPPGGTVTRDETIPFPAAPMGPMSILVCADSGGTLGESDESNNCRLEAVCVDCLHPDLRPIAAPNLAAADDGETVLVSWTVANEGTADATGTWTDRIYLSADSILQPGVDPLLGSVSVTGPVPFASPGNVYSRSATITIPPGLHGPYFLIVHADALAAVIEPGAEGDNILAASTPTVISQPNEPDLDLQILTTAASVYRDTTLPSSWLVTNFSSLGTANGAWLDRLYLSADATLDPGTDTLLAEIGFTGLLGPGISYYRGTNPVIAAPPGSYTLFYVVDAADSLPETNDSNILSQPLEVLAAADLSLLPFSVPASATVTDTITVAWTVENLGSAAAAPPWVDRVYLSGDAVLDAGDTLVGSRTRLAALLPGTSYGESLSLPAPDVVDLYWVIIETDGAGQVPEALDFAQNRRVAGPIDVFSLTPPDLRVLSVASIGPPCGSPTGVQSGDPVTIQYTVTNEGIDPATGIWTDAIRISADASITNADPVLGSGVFQGTLLPGASYSRSVTVILPEDQPGCFRFGVQTDSDGPGAIGAVHDIAEADEGDNVLAGPAFGIGLAPQPDLAVTGATYVPTAFAGQTFIFQYSVANLGSAATDGGIWFETVHLVDLATQADIALLDTHVRSGPALPAGVTDGTRAAVGAIPVPLSGCYGIRVRLDSDDRITEEGAEGNNAILASALPSPVPGVICGAGELEVTPVVPLDLSPSPGSPGVPLAALARGGTAVVSWEAWNGDGRIDDELGAPVTFAQTWKDKIWYSADAVLDAADRELKTISLATTVDLSGAPSLVGVYPRSTPVAIPADLPVGPAHLLVQLNADAGLVETDFSDNTGALAIPVVIDPPDLAALLAGLPNPADAAVGQTVAVQWQVTNILAAPTGASQWVDRVYLDQGGSSTLLVSEYRLGVLAPGGTYTATRNVTIPFATPGNASLRVVADADGQVFEEGLEPNNTASIPLVIRDDAADLAIPAPPVLGSTLVNAGQPLTVSWEVENDSTFGPNVATWVDRVYLSIDPTPSADDVFIGARTHTGGLPPGESYLRTGTFTIPVGEQGTRFVVVRADGPNAVFESDETNNTAVATQVLTVAPVLPPNLVVASVAVTSSPPVLAGQRLDLAWSLTNAGSGDVLAVTWVDGIYLSTDTVLQTGADLFLGSFTHQFSSTTPPLPPAAGQTIARTLVVDVPPGISGEFHLLVRTDLFNAVPELGGEVDNVGSTALAVPIVVPDPSNLVVEGLSIPSAATIGTAPTITWLGRNLDSPTDPVAAVQGRWFDTVVLSLDDQVGEEDHILGTFDSGPQFLLAGDAIPRAVAPVIPAIPPGDYRVIVVTDALGQVPETDEENRFASVGTVQVLAIDLPPDVIHPESMATGTFRLFRLDASATAPGDTLELRFQHADPGAWTEVYIAFDSIPAPDRFDFASGLPTQPSQLLRIPDLQAGEYYVLARTSGTTNTTPSATIDWTILLPEIESATPDRIGNDGRVTVRFDGAGFLPELGSDPLNLRLDDGAGTTLFPRRLERIDSTRCIAEFDLVSAPLGDYDVVIQNGSVGVTTAPGLVTIEPLLPPILEVAIDQEASFRSGEVGTIGTVAVNAGNVDAPFVVLSHRVPAVLDRVWLAGRSEAQATLEQEIAGVIAESALVRSLPPGGRIALESDIRLEVLPEIEGVVPPGELIVQRGAAVLTLEEFIERMDGAAEGVRLAILDDPSLLAEPTLVLLQAELADPVAWRARWFAELVAAGLFDPLDLAVAGMPPVALTGAGLCGATSLGGLGVGECFAEYAAAAGDALVTSPPDEVLVALESGIEEHWDYARCDSLEIRAAVDPNEKTGPVGAGVEGFVGFQKKLPYTIYFENTASLEFGSPASLVKIIDPLPDLLSLESVRLGDIEISGQVYPIPANRIFYQTRLDLVGPRGVLLDVTAGVNVARQEVFWTFQSIDPATGLPPLSGNLGFLPPSDGSGNGSGSVAFEVSPLSATSVPEQIINRAAITFDTAAPILTNTASNRLDPHPPTSDLEVVTSLAGTTSALLTWTGDELPDESGIESFTLYAAPAGSEPQPILLDTTESSTVFTGTPGVTYELWVIARDFAGNVEALDADVPKGTVTLTGAPPTITAGPAAATACPGDAVTFSVTATGSAPFLYQWLLGGVPIPGATGAELTIDPVTAGDAGGYSVVVSNALGSAPSAVAALVVLEPPEITRAPVGVALCAEGSATLSVTATGSGPLAYQWTLDGIAIAGATDETLELGALGAAIPGAYTVEVSNACGAVTSPAAIVTVGDPPSITLPPAPATVCAGLPLHLEVGLAGTPPIQVQWLLGGSPIPGATSTSYDVAAVGLADQGEYSVEVSNACGTATSAPVMVAVHVAPSIVADPSSASACVGTPAAFSVIAEGSPPLFYQWFRDGQPIPGSTATLAIPAVATASAGAYSVQVSNGCGSAISAAALLTVLEPVEIAVPPAPADLCDGEPLSLSVAATGSAPLSYQWSKDGVDIPGATGPTHGVAAAAAADAGLYRVAVTNPCGSVTSAAAEVVVRDPPAISDPPDPRTLCEGGTIALAVVATGSEPLAYQWTLDGADIPGASSATLTIPAASPADAGTYAVRVTNPCGDALSAPAVVTVDSPPHVTVPPADPLPCPGEPVLLQVTAEGTGPLSYQWFRSGALLPGEVQPSLAIAAVDASHAGLYRVDIENGCGAAEASTPLTVLSPPTIPTDPAGAQACPGMTVTLSVVALGTPPLSYQWLHDGAVLPGEEGTELVIAAFEAADAGDYTVQVSNGCGVATSLPAAVSLIADPMLCDCNENGIPDSEDIAGGASLDADGDGIPDECQGEFLRGDVNQDGLLNLADAIAGLEYLFLQGAVDCLDGLDANDDGLANIADPIALLAWLYLGGVPPPPPFPACGDDPTADPIYCDGSAVCP